MPNASTTQTSSASDTTGTPIPLAYGYGWVTGKRQEYYQLLNTGNANMDFTRLGIWTTGHGEWDGPQELWLNDKLAWQGGGFPSAAPNGFSGQNWVKALDGGPPLVFNFHRGSDAPMGAPFVPASSGPDQGLDVLWAQFPPAINQLFYSRIAYYAIMRKQPIENQTNTHQNDPTQWTDIAPIGLWRTLRCRLFDDEGNQTGYAFTTNPAWHYVDAILKRKIYPDYGLDFVNGPDPLTVPVKNRFDWGTIYSAAQYFDEFLPNGRRRFEGNYGFSAQTTLQAILEQILLNCRSFSSEYAGKIGLNPDMPRSSVFTFSRQHILPGSWDANDQALHKSGNRYIANFRDLLVPQCSDIASITCAYGGNPEVTTTLPHPFENGDYIAIGGTGTTYDSQWQVLLVPDVIDPGTPGEVDPSTFTMVSKGSNYPESVGAGGGCGLLYSRFKERAPEFWHKANMLARGAVGLGIPRQRNKVKQSLDYATTTWDQASRLTCYERDRLLGIDPTNAAGQLVASAPYVTPPCVKFRTSQFAKDVFGNLVAAVRPGDHVTIDTTANFKYAGEYEVLDPLGFYPPTCQAGAAGGAIALKAGENSGEIEFALGPYNEAVMYDTSDPTQAGWPSVPGSDPGNNENFTSIPLAAGQFCFFTGAAAAGADFQLPSTGYPVANALAWTGPQGFLGFNSEGTSSAMATISLCEANASFMVMLQYMDNAGSVWNGDDNYACVCWLSADVPTTSGGLTWIELTLLGGEKILFGQGVVADGTVIELPSPYTAAKSFMTGYPHDGVPTDGNDAHWVGAFVDDMQTAHLNYKDGEGNVWHGNLAVLVFAWQNNMGSVTTETVGGGKWMQCTLTSGQIFGVGCALGVADGSTLELPAGAGDGSTLEAMVGTSGWDYLDNGHHAHGVYACYLDSDNVVHIQFGDGEGNMWSGAADVFALYCTSGTEVAAVVIVSPLSVTVAAGVMQQFSATVLNNSNPNVTWSVDGIPGGNLTVGTVDWTGNYTAPAMPGSHEVIATSVAEPTSSGSAAVAVTGSLLLPLGSSILTDDAGNIIYSNGNVIYVE